MNTGKLEFYFSWRFMDIVNQIGRTIFLLRNLARPRSTRTGV